MNNFKNPEVNDIITFFHQFYHENKGDISCLTRFTSSLKNLKAAYYVTSRAKFPVYDVDFGQGPPMKCGRSLIPIPGFSAILPLEEGDGVECFQCFLEEEYAKFKDKVVLEIIASQR